MRRPLTLAAAVVVAIATSGLTFAQNTPANLQIHWIDTEGGAATLIVSPAGESLLIDTGYPDGDRDAKRILAAAQKAGISKIDHVLISHFHNDHVGGLEGLAKMIRIDKFYDHGDTVDQVDKKRLDDYKLVAGNKRVIVKPGDKIELKGGVQVLVVASDAKFIDKPVNSGGPNPLCEDAARMSAAAGENQRTIGVLVTYNNFTYLNTIDLDWASEMALACPLNRVGAVTIFQSGRHGAGDGANAPGFIAAIRPQVLVVNNGPRKGFGATDTRVQPVAIPGKTFAPYERNTYLRYAKNPGIEGIWQGHLSLLDKNPAHNTSPDMIANFEEIAECQGHAITASVAADGRFTMANTRNGFSKSYAARRPN
jgi:beta-lactamase superfamily II metal-dependent hydrolase